MPTRALKIFTAVLAASVLVVGAGAQAAASNPSLKVVPGSASPLPAGARMVGRLPGDKELELSVTLQPRNPELLASLAARSSAREPLDPDQLKALFYPTEADVAAVRSYFGEHGLRFRSVKGLTVSFRGPARAAEEAFGVELRLYRDSHGRVFRAPTGPLRLPAGLTGKVAAVHGLDTFARYRPAAEFSPNAVTPSPTCGASGFQSSEGGYLPADLAAAGAYNYQTLLDAGFDGTGERIAFVEFSSYRRADVTKFKDCFGLTTPVIDVAVNDGTSDPYAGGEVALDVEIALGAAPDLDAAYVYIAPNPTSMAVLINKIVDEQPATGVRIVSISWGLCEAFVAPGELAATNTALQLAAVSGVSVYGSSGDYGSSGCLPDRGGLAVSDPASQPYATAVGGTNLDLSSGRSETTWNSNLGSGGGGLSSRWPMPSWQTGVTGADSSGAPCAASPGYCRQVPDVALNADPENGYVIYCFTPDCSPGGWLNVGGTSASAPLLAGMTADANEYSLDNGGARLGFASPFFYDRFAGGATFFADVSEGSNDVATLGKYDAGDGYDLATGLGSLDGFGLAQELATYDASDIETHATALTASPTTNKTITYGKSLTLSGVLTDTTTGTPIAGRLVWVELSDSLGVRGWGAATDAAGHWSLTLSTQFRRKATWRAYYLGEAGRGGAGTATHTVYVRPKLTTSSSLKRVSGHYVVRHGTYFTVSGESRPNMAGAAVTLQWRPASSSRWRSALKAGVSSKGKYAAKGAFSGAGRYYMRWRYSGSTSKPWLDASSPAKLFVVS